ncbi:MAG: hypothetical protein HDT14_01380 [Oscillibacter sp.]|nr:hypothetical protein [Oscillibacter sp.]
MIYHKIHNLSLRRRAVCRREDGGSEKIPAPMPKGMVQDAKNKPGKFWLLSGLICYVKMSVSATQKLEKKACVLRLPVL